MFFKKSWFRRIRFWNFITISIVVAWSIAIFFFHRSLDSNPLTISVAEARETTFFDIDSKTELGRAVKFLNRRGIVRGFPDGTFRGRGFVTRAEISKMLLLASGRRERILPEKRIFRDVSRDEWFAPVVAGVLRHRIANGYPDGTFRPNDLVNRAEFLKMFSRAFDTRTGFPTGFLDVGEKDWFFRYAEVGERFNLFPGATAFLHPERKMTRAEVAVAIFRAKSLFRN